MAEAAFKHKIATFIRQTRPQSFRSGKPLRYPQRTIAGVATNNASEAFNKQTAQWQTHPFPLENGKLTSTPRLHQLRNDPEPRPFSSFLTDTYSREHNYLRISLTERCNLRCLYCMPEEGVPLSPPEHILTTPEIVYLSTLFVNQGVDKIRLTGGEPTVRKDILDLMQQIGKLRTNGLKELCLTTNGISLYRKLDAMVEAGLTGVNLSLDTLDPFQFTLMTRRNGHEAVMKSINRILDLNRAGAGIKLKINCVVMRGINEREILPFVEMGRDQDLEVRFIEYMPFDGNKWSQKKMLPFEEMLATIKEKFPDVHKVQGHLNDTSKTYKVPGYKGRIGFITSMTHNFCGTCNRLRITSDGNLKVCLFGNSEVSLRDILRESNNGQPIDAEAMDAIKQIEMAHRPSAVGGSGQQPLSDHETRLLEVIGAAVKRKKAKHAGMGELENMKNRPMILIDRESDHVQTSVPYPSLQPVEFLYRASPSLSRHRTHVPLHLLSSPIMSPHRSAFVQTRSMSRMAWRRVASQGTHRWIKLQPGNSDTPVEAESLDEYEHQTKQPLSSDTVSSVAQESLWDTVSSRPKQSLTHLTRAGEAHMVDISGKKDTARTATATSSLYFSKLETMKSLLSATLDKGDALSVARVAAIQAAKKTSDIIPLAHPGLGLTSVHVDLIPFGQPVSEVNITESSSPPKKPLGVRARVTVSCHGKTGVEMEALTSATAASLTLYDMLKGIDKGMWLGRGYVMAKSGGRSGSWVFNPRPNQIKQQGKGSATQDTGESDTISSASDDLTETNLDPTEKRGPQTATKHVKASRSSTQADRFVKRSKLTSSPGVRTSKLLPTHTKLSSMHRRMQLYEDRLRVEHEKLKLQQRQFALDQQKVRLSSIDIDAEVRHRANEMLKEQEEKSRNQSQLKSNNTDPTQSQAHARTITAQAPFEQNSSPSADTSNTSDPQQPKRTDGSTSMSESPSTMPSTNVQEIKFNRASRDIMSGTYSNRTDSRAFELKRAERYEDWARER